MDTIGRVQVVGVRGKVPIEAEFLHRVTELSPTGRRLAIAQACIAPWQESPAEAPACYLREHELALYLRREEERHTGQARFDPASVLPSDEPILKSFLVDLVGMTPGVRRLHMALAYTGAWNRSEDSPEWVRREYTSAGGQVQEEDAARKFGGS